MSFASRLRRYLPRSVSSDVRPVGGDGPRGFVGGLWHELGELQFRFLIEQGLRPEHVLLDIACGSLRAGCRFVPYLNPGNYLGIDMDASLIEHGRHCELGATLYSIKRPEFVVSPSFEFHKFSKWPDFAIAQSLFTHLTASDILLCLQKLKASAKSNTVLYATFFEVAVVANNPLASHPHAGFRYSREQMNALADQANWQVEYIGNWNHPHDQKMLRFSLVGAR